MAPENTYYLCFPGTWKKEPLKWHPFDPASHADHPIRTAYFSGVFQAMEQHLRHRGLTFYLTPDLRTLPRYGPDVVAVIQGDEAARIPAYFHRVRATFKCYGTRQVRLPGLFTRPSYQNLLAHTQRLRDIARRLPGRLHQARQRLLHPDTLPPIYPIPLGYANQLALPIKPITERTADVFFAGSVAHSSKRLRRWFGSPKEQGRLRMLAALEQVRRERPDLRVDLRLQSNFRHSIKASAAAYSEGLMNARICLVPRGASFETYRFFEAMRYGCITLAEALPPYWFYENAPVVTISDWKELPYILPALLADEEAMQTRHAATLAWWETRCSETVVGHYFAEKLNSPGP